MESNPARSLQTSDKLLITVIIFSNFMEGVFFTFLISFFPQEILSKGLTSKDVGIITAMFPLASIISSFAGGYVRKFMKLRTMYLTSYLLSSGILLPFAFVLDIENVNWFYISCMLCRGLQGVGYTGIQLSSMDIITTDYQQYLGTILGMIGTTFGIGCAFGSFYPGFVYQYVGTKYIFFSLSAMSIIFQCAAIFLLKPKCDEAPKDVCRDEDKTSKDNITLLELLRIPEFLIPLSSKMVGYMTYAFVEISLANFLNSQFGFSTSLSGTIMMIGPLVYMVGTSLTGMFVDRYGYSELFLVFGLMFYVIHSVMAGPVPFLRTNTTLFTVLISTLALDIGSSLLLVSIAKEMFSILRRNNKKETAEANNHINSLLITAGNIGNLIGPVTGGLLIDCFGYKLAALQTAVISSTILLFEAIYFFKRNTCRRKRTFYENIETIQQEEQNKLLNNF